MQRAYRRHPQRDVFRIIDGKKQMVEPYLFSTPEETGRANLKSSSHIESIAFDGETLTTKAIDEKGREIIQRLPAVSGKKIDGLFDYSSERQKIKEKGPIPEGRYRVNPQKIEKRTLKDDTIGIVGSLVNIKKVGRFPGGRYAWGDCRLEIQQTAQQKKESGRSGFSIHGGKQPGSAGCIDLMDKDKDFCSFLEKYRGVEQKEVPLEVQYHKQKIRYSPKVKNK